MDSAFIDTYGDFERMVETRRFEEMRNGGSRLPFAQATTQYTNPLMTVELIASDQKIADLKSKHLKSLANPDGKYTD